MSTRGRKRRRLDEHNDDDNAAGNVHAESKETSAVAPITFATSAARKRRTSKKSTQDAQSAIDSTPTRKVRSSPALKSLPPVSSNTGNELVSTATAAPAAPADGPVPSSPAPRSYMDIWREAKSKSQGYRLQARKALASASPAPPTRSPIAELHNGLDGAHARSSPLPNRAPQSGTETQRAGKREQENKEAGPGKLRKPAKLTKETPAAAARKQGNTRKKTFEDEMRELEAAARQEAEDEDNNVKEAVQEKEDLEGEEDEQDAARRMSSRKARPSKRMEEIVSGRAASPASAPGLSKPLDRRKQRSVHSVADDLDTLSVDESTVKVRHVGRDVEMMHDSDLLATPTKPKARHASNENVPKTDASLSVVTPETHRTKQIKELHGSFEPQELQCIQRVVLEKATGKRAIPLVNLDAEFAKVATVVNQTVTAGESNSMLLIGARGCGKTALVNRILQEQRAQNLGDFYVVRLNGFIHTDDKIALREIWRQLGREMDQEEEALSKNYADTLTTLLALLSHPAEMGTELDGQVTKSVIFVMDEFELFATHPRQTLLYNLFDIAQSRKAPIAVLGLTTKIDVAESLEKRVRSRFSHRYVHLSLAKSFQAYEETCKMALCIAPTELTKDEMKTLHVPTTDVSSKLHQASNGLDSESSSLIQWSEVIEQLFALDSVEKYLRQLYYTTKSVPQFLAAMLYPASSMPIQASTAASEVLTHLDVSLSSTSVQPPDSKLTLLPSLSTLQMGLLVCAARLSTIFDAETVSFALAYDEYKTLASKVKLQASASGAIAQGAGSRVWGRDLAKAAWEALIQCGFILEDGRAGGAGRVDIGLEEIGMSGADLGIWARWCKEV